MAWVQLTHRVNWDMAGEIADKYENSCVGVYKYTGNGSPDRKIRPILFRKQVETVWYNYYDNTNFVVTSASREGGCEPRSYMPYIYMPDKVRYIDMLSFLHNKLASLAGVYHTYVQYTTADNNLFAYYFGDGSVLYPVSFAFLNPLLFFVAATVRYPSAKTTNDIRHDPRFYPVCDRRY